MTDKKIISIKNTDGNKKRDQKKDRSIDHKKTIFIAMIVCITTLCGIQIFLTNTIAVQGEEIKKYEEQYSSNKKELEIIQLQVHQTGSLKHIEKKAIKDMQMVDISNHIIHITPDQLASTVPE